MPVDAQRRSGRPRTSSLEEVSEIALRLFVRRGFEQTTLQDVADAVGVSKRTLLRYFPSKNDIVWGAFDEQLQALRARLADSDPTRPMMEVLREAVVAFNDYGEAVLPELRDRMTLITSVPALQAHSMLRYADWCAVIAEFVARRLSLGRDHQIPQVIASAALGTAMATYRCWVVDPDLDLLAALDEAFRLLAAGFDAKALGAGGSAHAGRRGAPRSR
jgi:TetR/AcrR family transcriptional regulator, regulator of mycofactocin system